MRRIITLALVLTYAALHLGCTCDCQLCVTSGGFENCQIKSDVKKAECQAIERQCVEGYPEVTCSGECK